LNTRRLLWFALLWLIGILSVGIVALALKLVMREVMSP